VAGARLRAYPLVSKGVKGRGRSRVGVGVGARVRVITLTLTLTRDLIYCI